jgi:predicted amidohydrolase
LAIDDCSLDAIEVACAQPAPVFGDLEANRRLAARAVRSAATAGAHVGVRPELYSDRR